MDPLTVLGAISTVMGIVDIGTRLLSGTISRYKSISGAVDEHIEVESATAQIKETAQNLESSLNSDPPFPGLDTSHQQELQTLCGESKQTADELLALLERLKVPEAHRFTKSIIVTIHALSKDGRIQKLRKKLEDIQKRSSRVLIAILNDKQSQSLSAILNLSHQVTAMQIHMETSMEELRNDAVKAAKQAQASTVVGVEQAYHHLQTLTSEIETRTLQVKIVKSLQYSDMRQRYNRLQDAMSNTFSWIFEETTTDDRPPVEFLQWLQSGNGIYWISGHPGSGKSTLMKFICSHSRTQSALERWASSKRLVMASHFFWIQGNAMQKSQEGLLSALLENILIQCPGFVSTVAPVWSGSTPWSFQELETAFSLLKTSQSGMPVRFCFFVDALDEYEGDHNALAGILKALSDSPDVKICVSSREWPVFTYHFDSLELCQKLKLQEHTREDIKTYIRSTMEGDPRFRDFESALEQSLDDETEHKYSEDDLVSDICNLAQGVFLWVYLVCLELLKGLTNKDTMNLLKARLYELPQELDEYFMRMLEKIDRVYHHRNSQILQILSAAYDTVPLSYFAHLDQKPNFSLLIQPRHESTAKYDDTREVRLKAQGGDLITILYDPSERRSLKIHQVAFLHRTVRDFLTRGDMKQFLLSRLQGPFDPISYLGNASLVSLKTIPLSDLQAPDSINYLLSDFLWYARRAELQDQELDISLLDEMEREFCKIATDYGLLDYISKRYKLQYHPNWILHIAALGGLKSYLSSRLSTLPELAKLTYPQPPLLDLALQTPEWALSLTAEDAFPEVRYDLVRMLLDYGASPNQEWQSGSIWQRFLRRVKTSYDPNPFLRIRRQRGGERRGRFQTGAFELIAVVEALIRAGADLKSEVIVGTQKQPAGIGAGRSSAIKMNPVEILRMCCSEEQVRSLQWVAAQYDRPGLIPRLLRALGWTG